MEIRRANIEKLDFIEELGKQSFNDYRRFTRSSLKYSLLSSHQIVLIAEIDEAKCGTIILKKYKKQVLIYSIAVSDKYKNLGVGSNLMMHAIDLTRQMRFESIAIEIDTHDSHLLHWFGGFGFESSKVLVDYYGKGKDAIKMTLKIDGREKIRNVVVTDYDTEFFKGIPNVIHIRANTYIENVQYHTMRNVRVFNLCSSMNYQTVGYYVSLLAAARNQVAFPNITSLRDFKSNVLVTSIGEEIFDQLQKELKDEESKVLTIESYFGNCLNRKYRNLNKALNALYEAPLLCYQFEKKEYWTLKKVTTLKLSQIESNALIKHYAIQYFSHKRFIKSTLKNYKYDLAILIDESEKNPPSDKIALSKFKLAAESLGFYVETIAKKDYEKISEFDALFIRATTNVSNYTYDFSRYAYSEGLVVIDDPWSILRCSNKLYLFEALRASGIKMPATWTLNKKSNYKNQIKDMHYPTILKQPDSAFSIGVYKVENAVECKEKLDKLFKKSEIIIAQEYLPTEYDWRIGIMDRKPIFACKYYMAKGHWQIYNWDGGDDDESSGSFDTMPIDNVPKKILNIALDAANLIGDGLYGVDLKEIGGEVYVIEVNDNPNIDYGVEDEFLKDDLYLQIMKSLYDRLDNARETVRPVSF